MGKGKGRLTNGRWEESLNKGEKRERKKNRKRNEWEIGEEVKKRRKE